MSETPTTPAPDEKSGHNTSVIENRYTVGETDRNFKSWEQGFGHENDFDLQETETINPDVWTDTAPEMIDVPVHAEQPRSRAQEVEEPLFYLPKTEILSYGNKITQAVIAIRRAA